MCPLTQGLKIIGISDRWRRVSKCQSLNPKEVVFSKAPAPSLSFTLEDLHAPSFLWWGGRKTTGVSFPATQRAVEPVLVPTLVVRPFHITPLSSTSPQFTHTGRKTGSQFCGCWRTALKIVFADSTKKVSEEFNFRRKICSCVIEMLFLTLEVSAFPTILWSPQSHPPVTQLQTFFFYLWDLRHSLSYFSVSKLTNTAANHFMIWFIDWTAWLKNPCRGSRGWHTSGAAAVFWFGGGFLGI